MVAESMFTSVVLARSSWTHRWRPNKIVSRRKRHRSESALDSRVRWLQKWPSSIDLNTLSRRSEAYSRGFVSLIGLFFIPKCERSTYTVSRVRIPPSPPEASSNGPSRPVVLFAPSCPPGLPPRHRRECSTRSSLAQSRRPQRGGVTARSRHVLGSADSAESGHLRPRTGGRR